MSIQRLLYKSLFGGKKKYEAPKRPLAYNYCAYQELLSKYDGKSFITRTEQAEAWYESIKKALEVEAPTQINLFISGLCYRAEAVNHGFEQLTKSGNFFCAFALIRMQLDNSLTAYAGLLATHKDQFFKYYNEGKPINRLEDENGNKLTQGYLVRKLSEEDEQIKPIFEEGSSYIHTSTNAQDAAIDLRNEFRMINYSPYKTEANVRNKAYHDMVLVNNLLIDILNSWIMIKHNN